MRRRRSRKCLLKGVVAGMNSWEGGDVSIEFKINNRYKKGLVKGWEMAYMELFHGTDVFP